MEAEIKKLGRRSFCEAVDVRQEDAVKALIERTAKEMGRLDIMVNNAGASFRAKVEDISANGWNTVIQINVNGVFFGCKWAGKQMMAQGGGGAIINVSSLGGLHGYPLLSAYCASKWGQIGFTLACAEEGKADGIRVNAIAPGKADTAFRAQIAEDKSRMLKAEDHVGACIFLASDDARFVTGQVIALDWFGPPPGLA